MKIIDTHIHFYDLDNKINSWIHRQANAPHLHKNHLPETLIHKSQAIICGIVHVEAHDSNIPTTVEIEWLAKIMQEVKNLPYRHIALADITLPYAEFCNIIHTISKYQAVVGIRHTFSFHRDFEYSPCNTDLSNHPNIAANLKCLKDHNLIFACQGYPYQINNLLLAIEQAGVTCILDHFALPAWKSANDNEHKLWQETILDLSKNPTIFLKLSGLDMFKSAAEFDDILDFCLDNFPPKQLLYGSNNPVSFKGDYNKWYNYLHNYFTNKKTGKETQEDIFLNSAAKLFF